MRTPSINMASVKVMRSHDYCHFEVCLSSSDADTPDKVDALRKDAARLADKAVEQYRTAKDVEATVDNISQKWRLNQAMATPENERTPAEKAVIKYHSDAGFRAQFDYDYQDDYQPFDDEDEN